MTSEDGRPLEPPMKVFRPRDEAGRPLRPGQVDQLNLPDFDAMTLEECHAEAMRLFDEGNYFGAHEAWETCWGFAKGTEEEEFFKGLAQLGAGYTHWLRGNPHGVVALLGRALERIGRHGEVYRGIDVAAFAQAVTELRREAARAEMTSRPLPGLPRQPVPRA